MRIFRVIPFVRLQSYSDRLITSPANQLKSSPKMQSVFASMISAEASTDSLSAGLRYHDGCLPLTPCVFSRRLCELRSPLLRIQTDGHRALFRCTASLEDSLTPSVAFGLGHPPSSEKQCRKAKLGVRLGELQFLCVAHAMQVLVFWTGAMNKPENGRFDVITTAITEA